MRLASMHLLCIEWPKCLHWEAIWCAQIMMSAKFISKHCTLPHNTKMAFIYKYFFCSKRKCMFYFLSFVPKENPAGLVFSFAHLQAQLITWASDAPLKYKSLILVLLPFIVSWQCVTQHPHVGLKKTQLPNSTGIKDHLLACNNP